MQGGFGKYAYRRDVAPHGLSLHHQPNCLLGVGSGIQFILLVRGSHILNLTASVEYGNLNPFFRQPLAIVRLILQS